LTSSISAMYKTDAPRAHVLYSLSLRYAMSQQLDAISQQLIPKALHSHASQAIITDSIN